MLGSSVFAPIVLGRAALIKRDAAVGDAPPAASMHPDLDLATNDLAAHRCETVVFGERQSPSLFQGNSYVDRLLVLGGKIVAADVWNISAKLPALLSARAVAL